MALLGDTKLVSCLFFIACYYLTGELTDKAIIAFVSFHRLYFPLRVSLAIFSEQILQQDVGLKDP